MAKNSSKNRLAKSSKELRQEQKGGSLQKASLKVKVKRSQVSGVKSQESEVKENRKLGKKVQDKQIKLEKNKIKREGDYPSADEVISRARVEREKKIVMWSGVSFLMVAIIFFWFINTRNLIVNSSLNKEDGDLSRIWQDTQAQLEEGINSFQNDLEEIRQAADSAASTSIETVPSSSGPSATNTRTLPDNVDIDAIVEKLNGE